MKSWEFVFLAKLVSNLKIHKLAPVRIMVRNILVVTSIFFGISEANNCFDKSTCQMIDQTPKSYFNIMNIGGMEITHYHCIMKVTMDLAMDNMEDKFNHQCILIENLDYCVQYWKMNINVDCEGPIKNMIKQNFQVSSIWRSLQKKHYQRTNIVFLGYIGYI